MQTILILILWFPPIADRASPGSASLAVEFNSPAACHDARDTLAEQLSKGKATFVLECVPKGEIRT